MPPRTLADLRAEFDERGCVIIEDAIPPALVAEIESAVGRIEREIGATPRTDRFGGYRTIKTQNLVARDDAFRRLAVNEVIRPLVEDTLGPGYLLSTSMAINMLPGEQVQPLHCDDQIYGEFLPRPRPATVCNTIWAIDDFTRENGATRYLPGSHRALADPGRTIAESIVNADKAPPTELGEMHYAEMPAGSVLVLHGSLWHGGGANATDRRRLGIAMDHCAGWLRPSATNLYAMPLDEVRRCDPRLQAMLGFSVFNGIIGRIDSRTPASFLGLPDEVDAVTAAPVAPLG